MIQNRSTYLKNAGLLAVLFWAGISWHCQTQPAKSTRRLALGESIGDWYTTNRHMRLDDATNLLRDTITGPDGQERCTVYQITNVFPRGQRIFLLEMNLSDSGQTRQHRLFVFSENWQSMREFQGDQVITWTRSTWP